MLSDLPGQPREGGPSWVRVRFARHPWSSVWSEDGPKTDLGACMEEGGAAFLGTNKAQSPWGK